LYDEKNNRLDVARCLAEAKLVGGDLVPILASWPEDGKENKVKARVALACLEVLVPLTWPLEMGGEMTANHHRHIPYLQQSQVIYKAAVLGCDTSSILRQVVRIGLPSVAVAKEARTNREEGILKLMLYFFRNIAVIQQVPNLPSQGLDSEVSRSATIEAFRNQDVFALLLTICSNMGEDFNLQDVIVLDIIFNLIKGVDPKKLWMTEEERMGQGISELSTALALEAMEANDAKKNQSTRHGRFGTMLWVKREGQNMVAVSGQDNLKDDDKAFFNIDKSKKWNKPQQKRRDLDHTIHDFDRTTRLTTPATEKLRNFVEEFLDSGFNPFFTHLRKAIEREAERLLDVNYRQFFYAVAWFLEAERVRRETQKKEVKPNKVRSDFEDESYSLVAAVLNQETFIMLNRFMQVSVDNKDWQDLNASMRCFTQILLTVQEMAQSSLEEDQEIADNIQNRIFYEETTHERITNILKGYKDQGFGYLDACTELSHVFLRMLERYSKENVDLQIRSRRKAKKKRQEAAKQAAVNGEGPAEDEDEDSENEDIADVVQVSKERKFDFNRFAAKFSTQASVDTYVSLLKFYRDLSSEQLKRAHRFFYRVAFKQDLAVLLYRIDIVALFYKLINGPEGLDTKNSMFKEWSEFTRQVFKKMFKKIEQRPELIVELLFSKINSTMYYLEFGQEKQTISVTRAPAELEIRPAPGRDIKEQIGIVVTILLKDDKANFVRWVKEMLGKGFDERHGWEAEAESRKAAAIEAAQKNGDPVPTDIDVGQPSYITVWPTSDDIRTAMFKNARLKLLMRLVGFELLGDEDTLGAPWIIPGSLSAESLAGSKAVIEQYEQSPWQSDIQDEDVEDLLRRSRKQTKNMPDDEETHRDGFLDDSEGEEEFMFPDNPRKKRSKNVLDDLKAQRRKRKRERDDEGEEEVDDELAARRRAAREAALRDRRRKIKSEAYIRDSDDESDEERDRLFFEKEEQVRQKQQDIIRKQMALGLSESTTKETGKGKKKQKQSALPTQETNRDDDDLLMLDLDGHQNETASSQAQRISTSDEESEEDESTPLSSQISGMSKEARSTDGALRAIPQAKNGPAASLKGLQDDRSDENNLEKDTMPTMPRRQMRAGFIIDSDDDD
jgi:replication fork protection complex subunit Tof1/Swi1